jgi:hypothetical protein
MNSIGFTDGIIILAIVFAGYIAPIVSMRCAVGEKLHAAILWCLPAIGFHILAIYYEGGQLRPDVRISGATSTWIAGWVLPFALCCASIILWFTKTVRGRGGNEPT